MREIELIIPVNVELLIVLQLLLITFAVVEAREFDHAGCFTV